MKAPRPSGKKPLRKKASDRRRRRRWLPITIVGLVIILGFWWWQERTTSTARVPTIDATPWEPAVSNLLVHTLQTVRASPDSSQAWGTLGMVLWNYEYESEALHCFQEAESLDAQDPRWPYWQGHLLKARDPERAVTAFEKAAQLSGSKSDIPRWQLALLLEELGKLIEATHQYERLLELFPNHAPARLGLARLAMAHGRWEDAAEYLEACLGHPSTARTALTLLASVQKQLGHDQIAASTAQQAQTTPQDQPWPNPYLAEATEWNVGEKIQQDRAQASLDAGRTEEALRRATQLTVQYPGDAENWLLLARAHLQQQDCANAERALRRLLQLDPDSVNGHAELGGALLCLERYQEAVDALTRTVQWKPDHGLAHFNLGFALARAGRGYEAIDAFRQAIRFRPDFIDAYITLGDLLIQSGQRAEAVEVLRKARHLDSDDERVSILLDRIK